ncbi:GNAT family N-acetyltransferase [Paenibacillus sp. JX-17]|uniref:GNAT family N-acetyltransferase n=1 Tax=Paenibacillus lacisoli TaxID=3064525 RepID=A0ABT9CGI2_9BACL|nr:GNAT family N-acetyltransferase [Paenibacillus sp. JX-17]MDO7906718.1 GNAT family N-acetyltransferase [Paenibacillus sp. JX-17]
MDIVYEPPGVEEYLELRAEAGLSPKSAEGAAKGLPNSLFAVTLREEGRLIGMGRVIGDGGCFFEVTDIAVRESYRGTGKGRLIMNEIMKYLHEHVPPLGFVSLVANIKAVTLYESCGFRRVLPHAEGMSWRQKG